MKLLRRKRERPCHLHPLWFKKPFLRALPLFFLPLVQTFFTGESPSSVLLAGTGMLTAYFFLLWQQSRWYDGKEIYAFRSGLFLLKNTLLFKCWAVHPQRETTPASLLTGACFFKPGVPSPAEEPIPLMRHREPQFDFPAKKRYHRASVPKTLLSAAFLSDPASGLLLATVFFRGVSSLLGSEIAQQMIHAADPRVRLIALGIPPVAAGISWLFLAGWLASFLREMMALLPFSWSRRKENLFFQTGLWPHRRSSVSIPSVSAASLLQTLPMILLGLYRAEAFLPGGEKLVLHPALSHRDTAALRLFLGKKQDAQVKPHRNAWFSFLWFPVLLLLLLVLLEESMLPFLNFLMPLFPLLLLPALWFFIIRLLGCRDSGIFFQKGQIYIRSIRIFTIFSARIDPGHITGVQFLQNPVQQFTGNCTLVLQTTGGRGAQYRLLHVPMRSAQKWVQENLHQSF